MKLSDYQEQAVTTARYPGQQGFLGLAYATLGLNGEAGETAEQIKKVWRDDSADIMKQILDALSRYEQQSGHELGRLRKEITEAFVVPITPERHAKIVKELGDVLWYAAQIATEIGVSLDDVAQINIDKLASRRKREKLHGSGDDR